MSIEAILRATSEENKKLMAITSPGLAELTFEDQLKAIYGDCRPLHNPERAYVFARQIWQRNVLNIEKIKQENALIEVLINPTSYFKEFQQKIETDKDHALKQTSDSSNQSTEFIQTKTRGGGIQSYEEHDMERAWDESDEKTLRDVMKQPKRNIEASDWTYEQNDVGNLELVEAKVTDPMDVAIQLQNNKPENVEDQEGLALDSISIGTNRSVTAGVSSGSHRLGKNTKTRKDTHLSSSHFVKADAIERLNQLQLINWREKIIQSFSCLFVKNYYGSCQ